MGRSRAFRRLLSTLAGSPTKGALVPVANNNESIVDLLWGANLNTEEDLVQFGQQFLDLGGYEFQGELGSYDATIPSGLCHEVTGAVLQILHQNHAQNILSRLDSEYVYVEETEALVGSHDCKEAKLQVYHNAIFDVTSD